MKSMRRLLSLVLALLLCLSAAGCSEPPPEKFEPQRMDLTSRDFESCLGLPKEEVFKHLGLKDEDVVAAEYNNSNSSTFSLKEKFVYNDIPADVEIGFVNDDGVERFCAVSYRFTTLNADGKWSPDTSPDPKVEKTAFDYAKKSQEAMDERCEALLPYFGAFTGLDSATYEQFQKEQFGGVAFEYFYLIDDKYDLTEKFAVVPEMDLMVMALRLSRFLPDKAKNPGFTFSLGLSNIQDYREKVKEK